MAISHAKSVTIADFTGTVTVFNSAGATTTANATDIVRPSNWNSAHDQYVTLSGNTAGASTLSGSNIVFQGGNNVTLSGNGSTIVFSGPTQTAFVLSNSNGISFGTNGSTVTASHNGLTSQSNQAFSAAGGSSAFQTLVFANSNGVSFSNSNGSVVGSVETSYAASNHSHGNPTLALTNLSGTTASASNGLTLSLSAAAPGAVTLTNYATGNTTQSSSGTIAGSSVIFRGSGGVSAGISNGSVVVEGPALTSLSVTGALSASSNGSTISLGVGTVTASAVGNTTQTSTGTINLNALVFSGAGGNSVGFSNGSVIISGATGGGGGGAESNAINLLGANTAGNTTATGSTIGWSGVNLTLSGTNASQVVISAPATSSLSATGAVSLSTNGSTISIGVGTVTANAASNTTQGSTGTVNLNAMTFHGAGIASVGVSNGSVVISVPSGGGAGDGVNILAAGTQTAATTGTVAFSNSNGITFGMSNSSVITASHNGLTTARASNDAVGLNTAQTNVTWTVNSAGISLNAGGYAGTGSGFTGGASISGSITHNTVGLSLSLSHPAWITTAALSNHSHGFSAAGGSSAFQTLSFSNANGASFTNTNGQVGLSYSVPVVSNAIQAVGTATGSGTNVSRFAADDHVHEGVFSLGVSTGGNTAGDTRVGPGRFVLAGGANITLSQATGANGVNTVSIVGGAGGGGGVALSAGGASVSNGTVVFSNSNGITFGLNASTVTASHNGLTSQSNQAFSAGAASSTFQTLSFQDSNGISFSNNAGAIRLTHGLAGTGTTFAGANISASITLNSAGLNLSASVAAPGAAAENNAINLLGANTAGNTTATGSTIGWSGVNLTLSGTNASQVVISAPATSSLSATGALSISTNGSTISIGVPSPVTYSYFNPQDAYLQVAGQQGQGTLHIQPAKFPNVSFDRWVFPIVNTNSSNSSGSHTISFWIGVYTRNDSSLSLLMSTSASTAVTHSGTAGSYSLYSGMRNFTIGHSTEIDEGQYYIGMLSRTTSGGANGSYSQMLCSQVNSSYFGFFGQSVVSTMQYTRGLGVYTATTSGMPSSIAFSQISGGSNSLVLRQPVFYVVNGTY